MGNDYKLVCCLYELIQVISRPIQGYSRRIKSYKQAAFVATQPFVLLLYNRRISSFGRALFKSSKKLLSSPPTNPTLSLAQHFQSLAILYCHANWQCSMTPICSYLRVYCNRKIGRKKELKSYNVIWRQQWPRSVRTQQEWLIQGHLTHIHRTDTKIARWDRVSREGKGTRAQEFGGSKHATIF